MYVKSAADFFGLHIAKFRVENSCPHYSNFLPRDILVGILQLFRKLNYKTAFSYVSVFVNVVKKLSITNACRYAPTILGIKKVLLYTSFNSFWTLKFQLGCSGNC